MDFEQKIRIRDFVQLHRGTLGELARLSGCSTSFLSQYLRGRGVSARLDQELPQQFEALQRRGADRAAVAG
jgi:transcriptional regulator with XRE-family HTH domain